MGSRIGVANNLGLAYRPDGAIHSGILPYGDAPFTTGMPAVCWLFLSLADLRFPR